jgi:hypothetical protein
MATASRQSGSFSRGSKERRTIMKRPAYTVIAMMALIGSMAVTAQAQTNSYNIVRASIPFEFNIGDKTMPAGAYTISQVNPRSEPGVLRIMDDKGNAVSVLRTQLASGAAAKKTALLFNRYGSHYYFSGVTIEGLTEAWQASKSAAERYIARELAVLNAKAAAVTVASR